MVQQMQQMASEGLLAVDPDIHGQLLGDLATASIVETINEITRIDKKTNKLHLFDAIRLACMQFVFEEVYA